VPPVSSDTLFRYCDTVYAALLKESVEVEGRKQWEGRFVELFSSLGISNSHYSRINTTLQELGCIELIRRGARGVLTMIVLHQPPTSEMFEGTVGATTGGLTQPTATDKLSQRLAQLERRIEGVDIKAYIVKTEKRLLELEAQVSKPKRRSA
jgi:hypothetical protein